MTQIRNAALAANLSSDFKSNWGDLHGRTIQVSGAYEAARYPVILAAAGSTVTLPSAAANPYKMYFIKKLDEDEDPVTVDPGDTGAVQATDSFEYWMIDEQPLASSGISEGFERWMIDEQPIAIEPVLADVVGGNGGSIELPDKDDSVILVSDGIDTWHVLSLVIWRDILAVGTVGENDPVDTFTDLSDAPSSYVGSAGYLVRVNSAETGLELVEYQREQVQPFTDWCAEKAQTASVSAYATKGNYLWPSRDINLLAVGTYMEVVDGGEYVARVLRVSGGQIASIVAVSEVLEVGGSAFYSFSVISDSWRTLYFRFAEAVALTNNTRYLITISRSDGADNYALPLQETATEYTDSFGWVTGVGQIGLIQKANPVVTDAVMNDLGQFNEGFQWYYTDEFKTYGYSAPPAPPAPGVADYYVDAVNGDDDNDGSIATPFRTIQKAADTVVAGDLVQVRAGTYVERVRLTTSGTAGNEITFQNYPGERPVLDGAYTFPTGPYAVVAPGTGIGFVYTGLLSVEANYIVWDGINITRSRGLAVRMENVSNITITNCKIYSHRNRGVGMYGCSNVTIGPAVQVYDCGNYQVGSTGPITTWPGAIQPYNCNNVTITGCYVNANYGEGIILQGCEDSTISQCVVWDNKNTGIWVFCSRDCLIERNFVWISDECPFSPSDGMGTGLDVNLPPVYDNYGHTFRNNFTFGNRYSFKYNAYAGTDSITTSGFKNIKVYNNSFIQPNYHGRLALASCAAFRILDVSLIQNSFITNNIVSVNATKAATTSGSGIGAAGITWDYQCWNPAQPPAAAGANDVIGDPGLVREIGSVPVAWTMFPTNYRITLASICREAGSNLAPDVTNDYWGTARPQGVNYDIGAHEWS